MDTINFSVFENTCRTCLSTSDLTFINDTNIIDILQSLSDIKYSESDELPQKLCIKCIKFMNEIQSFIFKCQQAHLCLIKCLSDLKNKQNTLLENETIYIVNVEDILKKTKIINNLQTKQIVTKDFENVVAKEEFEDENLTLTNCPNNQKVLLNNTTMITDNIQETTSSNVEEYVTDQHNLELVTEYLEKDETVAHDKKQALITNSVTNQNILKNKTINIDEQTNKSEIIGFKEEIEDEIKNVELVTKHFVSEELLFHHIVVKEEIENEEDTILNSSKINHNINTNSVETISKKHKNNPEIVNIEKTQVITKKCNLKQHTGKQSFQCNVCNKIFTNKYILLRHKKIHITECSFKCDLCKKAFKTRSYLMTHKKIHSNVRQFKCDICKKVFKSTSYLKKHKKIHISKNVYQCDLCNKEYKNKLTLKQHMVKHSDDRRFECNICLKHFNLSYLNAHKRIHSNEKPYGCKICNERFTFKHNLVKHQVTHSDERPFECDFCSKTFKLAKILNRHIRLLHNGERRSYQCEICNEVFANKSNLLEHKEIHTDTLLVKCEFCTKKFTPNNMKQHKLVVHSKNEVQIFRILRSQKCRN